MGCNSSTSATPKFDRHHNNKNKTPSDTDPDGDNHNDGDRQPNRAQGTNGPQNQGGYEDETNKKLKDLEDEKKAREREKEEYDKKMKEKVEEEKREREEERKRENDKKNNAQKDQDERRREEEERRKREEEKRQKNEEEKRKEEEDRKNEAEEEKRRQIEEDDRREHKSEEVKPDDKQVPESRHDAVDSASGHRRQNKGLPYRDIHCGLHEYNADFRLDGKPSETSKQPDITDDLYTDHEFTLDTALGRDGRGLEWKRPQEFCDAPCLFAEGATRFDIGQGSAGTCWFLSLVASISEREQLMKQIYPETAYPSPGSDGYRGMFHCRFWRFGKWEDLYTDDKLPVSHNRLWGAKSATDDNEMWVALLEKGFAKFHGSYVAVYGGQSVDAFLTLTGGVGERVELKNAKPDQLFSRLTNAIQANALVTCTVPADKDGCKGLIGAHAYSLTGTTVVAYRGQNVPLLRVRNPWGKCEWTGPWSDGSSEWNHVHKGSVSNIDKDDGEFWIALDDFFGHFSQTSICSITPDFDMDGNTDCLDYITEMYGEWRGESAASYKNIMKNPRFLISVPEEGAQKHGLVPLVVQLVQWVEHRKEEKFSIRCDVYKVLGKHTLSGEEKYITEKMGEEDNIYYTEKQHSFRHCLTPGDYMIVPSTRQQGEENDFLVRVFSPCPLTACSKIDDAAVMMSCDMPDNELQGFEFKHSQCWFGTWKAGVNAGGQISHQSHCTNPQLEFTITGNEEAVVFNMMQENNLPKLPLGFKVYKLEAGDSVPATADFLLRNYEAAPPTTDGELGKFVISWDLNVPYVLPRGHYVAVAFTDQPNEEKDIGLVLKSSSKLRTKEHNLGL